jgi:hypothetical protein
VLLGVDRVGDRLAAEPAGHRAGHGPDDRADRPGGHADRRPGRPAAGRPDAGPDRVLAHVVRVVVLVRSVVLECHDCASFPLPSLAPRRARTVRGPITTVARFRNARTTRDGIAAARHCT